MHFISPTYLFIFGIIPMILHMENKVLWIESEYQIVDRQ